MVSQGQEISADSQPIDAGAIDSLVRILRDDGQVLAAYLFGSASRGESGPDSDLDVGVLFFESVDWRRIVQLQQRLEDAVGRDVDVVDVARCGAFLALDIVKGERIFSRNDARTDEFDLFVLRRAGDLAYFERERRRMILSGRGRVDRSL